MVWLRTVLSAARPDAAGWSGDEASARGIALNTTDFTFSEPVWQWKADLFFHSSCRVLSETMKQV